MSMKHKICLLLIAVMVCMSASAQNRRALRINEVMVQNDSSIVDEYGNRSGWIELFNANYGPLQISSVYLSTDSTNKKMYAVPLGDEKTKMGKRQHVIFYADGKPSHGTFHTNLQLVPGRDNYIFLYDADGITEIDRVLVPASLLPDQTYARTADGDDTWEVRTGEGEKYITPSSANIIHDSNNKVEQFARLDGHGFGMAVMAMAIVFSALLLLCISFYCISKLAAWLQLRRKAQSSGIDLATETVEHDSAEEIAAIVMALHQHLNAHDTENTVLTINKVKRAYSPWSSKIYGLRELPHR